MRPTETVEFVGKLRAACPGQPMDEYTPDAWAAILKPYTLLECEEAVIRLCRGPRPFLAPGEVATEVRRVRNQRLDATPDPVPPRELLGDPHAYLAWLRKTRDEIASSPQPQAIPVARRGELTAGE